MQGGGGAGRQLVGIAAAEAVHDAGAGVVVDGSLVASLADTQRAMRLVAEKTRVIAEGAGALAVAAALSGQAGDGPVVAVVSGGNIDLEKFCTLVGAAGG